MDKVINAIINFFRNIGTYLGADLVGVIGLALTFVVLLVAVIVSHFSIESKTNRKVKQISTYLLNNPFVTDENIVEFNRIMKTRIPRSMRYQWQKYMVNRKDKPSTYLSEENCITKPTKNSAFAQSLKQVKYIVSTLAIIVFMFSLGAFYESTASLLQILMNASVIPALMIVIMLVYVSIMNSKRSVVMSDLIYNFDEMQHQLDRAVTTFPAFVDYEILFTRKEIVNGIPALQEYLQQRAEYEQEQLEKARLSQVEHVQYDFSKLGVKGTLIMDRAMKECEFFLGNRKTLMSDIDSLQSQKDLLAKNYEEKSRGNQRKLKDIKDTIERLREKLNTTTNKIVGNDIIRQQAEEVKKQQLIEKEMDEDANHYDQEVKKLDNQMELKRKEIEDNRKLVENTLINDFKDYSDKIYDELKNIAESKVFEEIDNLKADKEKLEKELEDREKYIIQKNAMYDEKVKEADSFKDLNMEVEQLKKDIIVKDQEIIGANKEIESRIKELSTMQREIDRLKKEKYHEVYRYFDTEGREFFYDEKGEPFYFDNDGRAVYYTDADTIKRLKAYKHDESAEVKVEENKPVVLPLTDQEKPVVAEPTEEVIATSEQPQVVEEPKEEPKPAQEVEMSTDELNSLLGENKDGDDDGKVLTESQEEVQPEELPAVEEPAEEELPQPAGNAEQPVEEPVVEEEPAKEEKEEPKAEQPSNVDVQEEQTPNTDEIDKQIDEQNKLLEKQFQDFQNSINEAEKKLAKMDKKVSALEDEHKKNSEKEKVESKPKVSKPKKKRQLPTRPKQDLNKRRKVKDYNAQEKKTKKAKGELVFKVKKTPKTGDNVGIDLTGFNELFADQNQDNSGDKK